MENSINTITSKFRKQNAPSDEEYQRLLDKADFAIDTGYLAFMRRNDGMEGFISEHNYLQLWSIKDVVACNPYIKHAKESEMLLFFGGNGSDLGHAFDKSDSSIVSITFIDIGFDKPRKIADNFEDFIRVLSTLDYSL